jgi:hypothetical protein
VNLVRPHHLLRPSRDWNPAMASGALALYQENSRAPDPVAWERFDYLNAALRRQASACNSPCAGPAPTTPATSIS